jgi:hypothetical protein
VAKCLLVRKKVLQIQSAFSSGEFSGLFREHGNL